MRRHSLAAAASAMLLLYGQALAGGPDGKSVYEGTCIACHGKNGKGAIPGAPDLTASSGPLSKSNDVLKKRIIQGFQTPGSPMAMPPKGGNPGLSDQDIDAVIQYLRAAFRR